MQKAKNPETIFKKSHEGRSAVDVNHEIVGVQNFEPLLDIPKEYVRETPIAFPELSEPEIARHYSALAKLNYHVDDDMYPLGSCTMKYNPKISDYVANFDGFTKSHPLAPESLMQGNLKLMHMLADCLCKVTDLDAFHLSPAAGANGEFVGMKIVKAFCNDNFPEKDTILIPASAHGTNPASASLSGFKTVTVACCGSTGCLDMADLNQKIGPHVACIMITNPNTLGIFETHMAEISSIVHGVNGLVYLDGANFNAIIGKVSVKKMGVDVMHLNLHKTFATPHGGGGPGSGPVGVTSRLEKYLPIPRIEKRGAVYTMNDHYPDSIGRVVTFYGNYGIMLRALAYILAIGSDHLAKISENAVLNANYIKHALKNDFFLQYDRDSMHEVVLCDKFQKEYHVSTLDIAKRLIDYGFHPPTIYFPLIVSGALMIEPTETETKETMDRFIDVMKTIAKECRENPELVKSAPHHMGRLDEISAARNPVLKEVVDK